ncbi:MAG TPA: hypothetical protein PLL30_09530 [Candidatus Krumholzibacteria bacterium]|nr:hypothetical protein [Candidatus Krumholzibacteria bacterium]
MFAPRPRQLLIVAAVLCSARAALAAAPPPGELLRLNPGLPEILDREWLARLDLFTGEVGLVSVRFELAPWGAVLARLELEDPDRGPRVIVRNLTSERWQAMQARAAAIMAGETPPPLSPEREPLPAGEDPLAAVRSWPETPPPPAALPAGQLVARGIAPLGGHWLALVDAGARVNLSGYNQFFTPMAQIGLAFGYSVSSRLVPFLGFHAGFGDMRSDFEDAFGDGRANAFGFTLDTLVRLPVSERHSLYVEGGGGYFIRSLYWGGLFVDPRTGTVSEGRVLEQQNFGWNLRAGWLVARDHPRRPRFIDVGVGLQTSRADPWIFWTDEPATFEATGRDTWILLTVRFWDGL